MKFLTKAFEATDSTKCYESYTHTRAQNTATDAKLKSVTQNHYDHLRITNTNDSLIKFFTILTSQTKEALAVIGSKHEIYKDLLKNVKQDDNINITSPGIFKIADHEYNIQNFNIAAPQPMHHMHMARAMTYDAVQIVGFNDDQFEAINAGDDLYKSFTKSLASEVFTPYFNKDSIINQDFYSANNVISESLRKANDLADKTLSGCLELNNEFGIDLS
jgi:hypothetical protein